MIARRWRASAAMLATAALATAFAGHAQQQIEPLTLEDAGRQAVAWHPSLNEAVGTLNSREADIDVARAGYQPQITGGVATGFDNRFGQAWRPRPEVSASQMLFDFGKVASAVEAARAGTRAGRAELLLAVDDLVRETAYAFIERQRGEALAQVAAAQLQSIGRIAELVHDRYVSGAATKSDWLQATARVEAAQAMVMQIEAQQRRWGSNLAFLLGRESAPPVSAAMPDWLSRSCAGMMPELDDVPVVMLAEARRERATADLRRSRAEQRPTVALAGSAAPNLASPLSDRSFYNVGVRVSTDMFRGGAMRARVRGADYALDAAEAATRQARLQTGQRLTEAQQQVPTLTRLIDTLKSREANMAETGSLYRLQYLEMGTRTLVDLLNAEQEFHQVRFDAANTAHDLRRLQIDCAYHRGELRDLFRLTGTDIRGVTL